MTESEAKTPVLAVEWPELENCPGVSARIIQGQKFNAYETQSGGYLVAIGPVTNYWPLARCSNPAAANLIVAALRIATGQPPALSPLEVGHD